jgi:hypothetical protein
MVEDGGSVPEVTNLLGVNEVTIYGRCGKRRRSAPMSMLAGARRVEVSVRI